MPCEPNPCEHSGKCSQQSDNTASCDCSGTGYKGKHCEIGIIKMASFPQLVVGEPSEELVIQAKPDEVLEIRPKSESDAIVFEPSVLIIYPTRTETVFKVTAKKEGVFKIDYHLVGPTADAFEKPKSHSIYTYIKKGGEKAVDLEATFFEGTCHDHDLPACGKSLKLSSTCNWGDGSNGFITVSLGSTKIPVSVLGINERNMFSLNTDDSLFTINQMQAFLKTREIKSSCDSNKCPQHKLDVDSLKFITNNNLFQRAYYAQFSSLLPSWLDVKVDMSSEYFEAENFQSALSSGKVLKKVKSCSNIPITTDSTYSAFMPKSTTNFKFLSSTKSYTRSFESMCLAVDLCNSAAHVALPSSQALNFDEDFTSLNIPGIRMSINTFGIQKKAETCLTIGKDETCINADSYWKLTSQMKLMQDSATIFLDGTGHSQFNNLDKVRKNILIGRKNTD